MIANIFRILVLTLLPSLVVGQSLDLSVTSPTSNNNTSTFLLKNGEVAIQSGQIQFLSSRNTVTGFTSYGISPDLSTVGILKWSGGKGMVTLLNSAGDTLNSYSTITLADKASFGIYPFNTGNVLLRDKIANFTFYDVFGDIITNMSSSSQSKQGEAISKVVMSPDAKTVVIYNPKIKLNGTLASKAQLRLADNTFKDIYYSSDHYLKDVIVSHDGDLVVALTAARGSDDKVMIMDKYGNDLNSITSEEDLTGARISEDGEYLTLYSRGRVMVYSTLDGDRLGSTSFRSPVFLATYFPEDNLILALTGDYSGTGILNNVEFKAIDLKRRKITDKEFSSALGFTDAISPRLVRISANTYKLVGASKEVTIQVGF